MMVLVLLLTDLLGNVLVGYLSMSLLSKRPSVSLALGERMSYLCCLYGFVPVDQ